MERRQPVHAGSHRQALIAAIVLAAAPVVAAPSNPEAKKAFDKGVAAYQKNDYPGASAAFAKSFALETDAETLFAWAQAERKQDHCDKAIELYTKLLGMDLPEENKAVVRGQVAECKQIVDAQKPKKTEPEPPKPEPPKPEPAKPDIVAPPPKGDVAITAEGHAWYADPIGDALVIGGVVGLGVGGALWASAHSASQGIATAPDYPTAKALEDKANSRGRLGTISLGAGAALVVGGIAWYATHGSSHATTVSGWIAPGTGGIAIAGGF